MRGAVLDDWPQIARGSADWSALEERADVIFFHRAFAGEDDAAAALAGFDIIIPMRERTAFPASLIARLPRLRLIAMTGARAPSLDLQACTEAGILVCSTRSERSGIATAELALGLLLAAFRHIPAGDAAIRAGRFQEGVAVGDTLEGKTLGIIGLGRIGSRLARYAAAIGMRVLAWSQNLTEEKAREAGARRVDKQALLASADAVSLHLVLSDRTRSIISAGDLAIMKPGAVLVNTARGPLVDDAALLDAVREGRLMAALDVHALEPLPPQSPWRSAPNTVLTPHLGYGTHEILAQFYRESIENVLAFLDGTPIRGVNAGP
jgi:phosphoglycerate dehydrogenase-like enzyme